MDESKRSFLKIAGTSVLGTLGVTCGSPTSVRTPGQVETLPESLSAKKWGMVVDAKKCLQEKGCSDCIKACHRTHNVPTIDNPQEEVKWIWKETYEDVFPTQAHPYTEVQLKEKPFV